MVLEVVLDLQVEEVAKVVEEVEVQEKHTSLLHKAGSKMAQTVFLKNLNAKFINVKHL